MLLVVSSCASGPALVRALPPTVADPAVVQSLLDVADARYAAATERADVEAAMHAYEALVALAPMHREALLKVAELRFLYATDVLPEADTRARRSSYAKGRDYAIRALAHNDAWRRAYERDSRLKEHMTLLGPDDARAVYWVAVNWGQLANLSGMLRAALDISKIKLLMQFVTHAMPTYYGNAPDRFYIAYWLSLPRIVGRSADKSKAAYERAANGSPECLANDVLYAAYYATEVHDRALFERVLRNVLAAPTDDRSPLKLSNGLAKAWARDYLARADELFR